MPYLTLLKNPSKICGWLPQLNGFFLLQRYISGKTCMKTQSVVFTLHKGGSGLQIWTQSALEEVCTLRVLLFNLQYLVYLSHHYISTHLCTSLYFHYAILASMLCPAQYNHTCTTLSHVKSVTVLWAGLIIATIITVIV